MRKHSAFQKICASIILLTFLLTSNLPPAMAQALLPQPGTMLTLTNAFKPTLIKGINTMIAMPMAGRYRRQC